MDTQTEKKTPLSKLTKQESHELHFHLHFFHSATNFLKEN